MRKEERIERMLDKTAFTPESAVRQSIKRHLMRLSEQDIYILATQVAEISGEVDQTRKSPRTEWEAKFGKQASEMGEPNPFR